METITEIMERAKRDRHDAWEEMRELKRQGLCTRVAMQRVTDTDALYHEVLRLHLEQEATS